MLYACFHVCGVAAACVAAEKPRTAVPTIEDESFSDFIGESDENVDKYVASLEQD